LYFSLAGIFQAGQYEFLLPEREKFTSWDISNSHYVVARRVLALPTEAIPCYEETASAKIKNASQRHVHHENYDCFLDYNQKLRL
jgi:hypothetical protein